MKSKILNFSTKLTGYGHWLIAMEIENPNLKLSDDDYYWTMNNKEDETETLVIKKTTTNSRAIDGKDGFEVALAEECLRANDFYIEDFDTSSLRSEEE